MVSLANPGHARVVALALAGSRAIANATPQPRPLDPVPELFEALDKANSGLDFTAARNLVHRSPNMTMASHLDV